MGGGVADFFEEFVHPTVGVASLLHDLGGSGGMIPLEYFET